MAFQFHRRNYITGVGQLLTSSNSGTLSNIFDRNGTTKWVSSGENSDANTATISWVPGSPTIIDSIFVVNHNWAEFSVIFNSTPASQFSPALSVTSFSNSNLMYSFDSQSVNSIDFNILKTFVADEEKSCAEIIISTKKIELNANPSARGYRPIKFKKGIEQEMSDGGIVSVFLAQKFRAALDLTFIDSSTYDSLTAIYNEHTEFVFVPFPVNTFTTAFDGQSKTVNWTGDLDIDRFRNNALAGYTGRINIAEIPS